MLNILEIITITTFNSKYDNTTATTPPIIAERVEFVAVMILGNIKADNAVYGINFINLFRKLFSFRSLIKTKGSNRGIYVTIAIPITIKIRLFNGIDLLFE